MNDLDEKYTNPEHPEWDLMESVLATGKIGQQEQLEKLRQSGISLYYNDKEGNLVQKNPNGTIEIIQKA